MKGKKWDRFKKYIFKPQLLIDSIYYRIKYKIKYFIVLYISNRRKVKNRFGKNIKFSQKILINGNGSVDIGERCNFGVVNGGYYYKGIIELQARYENSKIIIGRNVSCNNNLFICAAEQVIIGDYTLIGEGVMIFDHNGHGIYPDERRTSIGNVSPINIGENVWIGSRVIVLPGTKIGNNSIVGAGAVIKGEFPENVVIAGNPAKIIRELQKITK